jgi:molecular chaperone GrpE
MTDEAEAEPTADAEDPADAAESPDTEESDTEEETGTEPETDSETESTAKSPIDRVAAHDEELAEAVREQLAEREAELDAKAEEIDELESKLKRKQADFQNFKKRQQQKVADQVDRATEDLVERLLPVRDNLARALEQGEDTDIREGVEGTLRELDRVLEDEGVTAIEPERGEEPDPERHEVMMRVESDQPAGTIEELYRPGYEMADRVIRTAQVTVSDDE